MKLSIILLLILIPCSLFAVRVTGSISGDEKVFVYKLLDHISNAAELITETKSSGTGEFSLEFEVDSVQQVQIEAGNVKRRLFVEPDAEYIVKLEAASYGQQLKLVSETGSGINAYMKNVEVTSSKVANELAMTANDYQIVETNIDELYEQFGKSGNEYIDRMVAYLLANFELNFLLKKTGKDHIAKVDDFLAKHYYSKKLDWGNPYFFGTFRMAIDTRCNFQSYKTKQKPNCSPKSISGIKSLVAEIDNELYRDVATLMLIETTGNSSLIIKKQLIDYFKSKINNEELQVVIDRMGG